MFMSFSKTIAKVGGFRFGIGMRLTKSNALWYFLVLAVVYTCQLVWYGAVLAFWLMYALFYGIFIGTKKLFALLSRRFSKPIATAIIVGFFAFLVMLGSCNNSDDVPPVVVPETTQTTATEATHDVPTEVATVATETQETAYINDAVELWKSKTEAEMTVFDYYDVAVDETGAIVSFATDGYGEKVSNLKAAGYDENHEAWVEHKSLAVEMCVYMSDYAKEYGLEKFPIVLIVLDDRNHDNMLLVIKDGEVVYDCLAEATTASTEATAEATIETTEATENNDEFTMDYVLNTNSKKFHYPSCSSAKQTKDSNKAYFTGTRDEVIKKGYSPCGRCCP